MAGEYDEARAYDEADYYDTDIGVAGPYYIAAAQAYVPGLQAADFFRAGAVAFDTYSPGGTAGESCPQ